MLMLKGSVRLDGIVPQMTVALMVVVEMFKDRYGKDVTVTSANDSVHGANSLHHRDGKCRALDIRTKHLFVGVPEPRRQKQLYDMRDEISACLPGFDVIMESPNLDNEHLHVEYDPK